MPNDNSKHLIGYLSVSISDMKLIYEVGIVVGFSNFGENVGLLPER
jgi:hypothetical protein